MGLGTRTAERPSLTRELDVKIANGFDPSNADDHGQNAPEIIAMTKVGLPPVEAIRAATLSAAELMGWQDEIGSIEAGRHGDIIAVSSDPLADVGELEHVEFVMKGGAVVRNDVAVH